MAGSCTNGGASSTSLLDTASPARDPEAIGVLQSVQEGMQTRASATPMCSKSDLPPSCTVSPLLLLPRFKTSLQTFPICSDYAQPRGDRRSGSPSSPKLPAHPEGPPPVMEVDLDAIAALGEQKARSEQYKSALEAALAAGDDAGIRSFIDHGGAHARRVLGCWLVTARRRRRRRRSLTRPPACTSHSLCRPQCCLMRYPWCSADSCCSRSRRACRSCSPMCSKRWPPSE